MVLVSSLILSPKHPGPPHMSGVSMKGSGDASDLTDVLQSSGAARQRPRVQDFKPRRDS